MKIEEYKNYRVTVYPEEPYFLENKTPEEQHRIQMGSCEQLIEEIKRHVDFDSIDYDLDVVYKCSFCGWEWEEEDDGQPVCCEAAVAEWEQGISEKKLAQSE